MGNGKRKDLRSPRAFIKIVPSVHIGQRELFGKASDKLVKWIREPVVFDKHSKSYQNQSLIERNIYPQAEIECFLRK